jgi:hypothetical protein
MSESVKTLLSFIFTLAILNVLFSAAMPYKTVYSFGGLNERGGIRCSECANGNDTRL